jgi:hypothetical protein
MVGEALSMYHEFELLGVSPQLKQWAYIWFWGSSKRPCIFVLSWPNWIFGVLKIKTRFFNLKIQEISHLFFFYFFFIFFFYFKFW